MSLLQSNPSESGPAAAWAALHKNDWQLALQIVAPIDFQLTDLSHLRLLCTIYLQAGRWDDLAQLSAVATQSFPEQPIFWEILAWTEYIQGHPCAALFILNNVAARFPHRESSTFMLAYIKSVAAGNLAQADHWLAIAAQSCGIKEAFGVRALAQPELKRLFEDEELFFPN
jgi:hypothetical protein